MERSDSFQYEEGGKPFSEEINPGAELRDLLIDLYPLNVNSEKSFLSEVDGFLKAEGNFKKIVYESSINYLLRRLINTAEFLRRDFTTDDSPGEEFVTRLRKFLTENIDVREDRIEKMLTILQRCLDAKNQNRRKSHKKSFIRRHFSYQTELRCYICGKDLSEEEVEFEHKWPKTMGGSSNVKNIGLCCSPCNKDKASYIDGSDFHYEHICLATSKRDSDSFQSEFKRTYKIALWAYNDFQCEICGGAAESVGRLDFFRRNESDSWHFLNIGSICEQCKIFLGGQENG
jgi:hypothetical protein